MHTLAAPIVDQESGYEVLAIHEGMDGIKTYINPFGVKGPGSPMEIRIHPDGKLELRDY